MTAPNRYGTTPTSNRMATSAPQDVNGDSGEDAGLLGRTSRSKAPTWRTRLNFYFNANVSTKWADAILLICYIITGLLDSSSTYIWGSFASMQTGNTIYVGLGIARPSQGNRWIRAMISIASFCVGSFLFARFHRKFDSRKRWVLITSFGVETLLIIVAAVIVSVRPDEQGSDGPVRVWVALPLALVALQAGGQTVASRVLEHGPLTSVVLTSIYCDLFSDQRLFAAFSENAQRNRRVLAPICLLLGAVLGGLWAEHEIGLPGALWTAAVLKGVLVIVWFFWAVEETQDD